VDPLREAAQKLALDIASGGLSRQATPHRAGTRAREPEPEFNPAELRKSSRDLMLQVLSGAHPHE
jgi:hypothetical protein